MNLRRGIELSSTYQQNIDVPFHFPVEFTTGAFDLHNPTLASLFAAARERGPVPKVRAWVDEGLLKAQPELKTKIPEYFQHHLPDYNVDEPGVYPGGELVKEDWTCVGKMIEDLRERHVCRHSYVLAIGGGAFLDAAGFAASLLHRGVRLIRMPSTVLSQDDSGVGVKNGVNLHGNKNFLGTFAPPFAVVNDFDLLRTLPPDIMRDGLSEAYKVAIIKDCDFFDFLADNASLLHDGVPHVLNETVERCARLHLDHIATNGDPFEMGNARPLDFGHWAAHRLEGLSNYEVRHGQAVAIGIALDSWYACEKGYITDSERDRIIDALVETGLPIYHPLLSKHEGGDYPILEGIEQFREHLGGILCLTLPDGLGNKIEISEIDQDLVIKGINFLAERERR